MIDCISLDICIRLYTLKWLEIIIIYKFDKFVSILFFISYSICFNILNNQIITNFIIPFLFSLTKVIKVLRRIAIIAILFK